MAHQLFQLPKATAISGNLTLLAGAKVRFYLTETTTPTPVYQDAELSTAHANPVVADSAGRLPPIYLDPSVVYKATFLTSANVEIYTVDPVNDQLLSQGIIGGYLYPRTDAEVSASVTPASYAYPAGHLWRYASSLAGDADFGAAFAALIAVLKAAGGGVGVVPPRAYDVASTVSAVLTPGSGDSVAEGGLHLSAYGATINFDGTGYLFDFSSPNTSALFYKPQLNIVGLTVVGTSSGAGAIRMDDVSSGRLVDVFAHGFTDGEFLRLRNTTSWSENNEIRNCGAVNCKYGIVFEVDGGENSFARTRILNFFGAGISDYWIDVLSGCSLYDSLIANITGNFGAIAYLRTAGDLSGTVIDGIRAELNGTVAGQGIIRLHDHPNTADVHRRPLLLNVGPYAGFTNPGNIPTWTDASGSSVQVEDEQQQLFAVDGGLSVSYRLRLTGDGSSQGRWALEIDSATPQMVQHESGAGSNEKYWIDYISSGVRHFAHADDTVGGLTDWMVVGRNGNAVDVITAGQAGTAFRFNGTFGWNTAPIAKPTVTGSRGSNAALQSLLTALANYGLITDSTS